MAGRETKCAPVKGEEEGEPAPLLSTEEPLSGVKLLDAPILLLVFFHKALLAELAELRSLAVEASEKGAGGRDLIPDLRGRFEFLKFAYKYHCAAEDEVIFLALDFCIKNVVCTYILEHKSIDDLLDNISNCLNALTKKEECTSKQFQELVFCFGTIQTTIRQHMVKEEKQVFPLLIQQFSSKEQGSLIWQFLCSVPIMLLEDFLPWLTSFLSPDEREDVLHCIKEVVPKEKLLQEVVISWLHVKNLSSSVSYIGSLKGTLIPDLPASSKDMLKKVYASKSFLGEKWLWKNASCKKTARHTPIYGLHLWHEAIRKDFQDILKDLYQIRSTKNYANLGSVTVQLKFFADVLIFYSTALDKIFSPVVNELANDSLFHFQERFQNESQIEGLRRLLYQKAQNRMPSCNFVEELCGELELFVMGISKHLALLETEVFPSITMNCTHEFQQWILYTSLRIMPLGLLKCMITWFSAQLLEDDCNSVLNSLKMGGPLATDDTFSFLLYEWVRMGYSGKTSIEKFREDLQEIFKSRTSLLTEHAKEDCAFFSLLLNIQPCNRSNSEALKPHSAQVKGGAYYSSSSDGSTAQKYHTPYSSWINLHIFSPQTLKILSPFPTFPAENSCSSSILNLEPRPVDHIFFFHKALKKDLEFLVNFSATLAENAGDLVDFCRRFQLVQFLYQIHSDSEDEIAFPALEAKGKAPNISRSYAIDHKLEVELFNKISLVLDELSGLCVSICSIEMDILDQRMLTYHQLCLKLHDMCKSMHQVLCDHIQREEVELWPLFRECFSIDEQEKIIGSMLGRTRAEILQEMIPWLMASLTPEEQQAMMSLWRKTTKNTMFDEWLREWWEGMKRYDIAKAEEESNISSCWTADPLKIISKYLPKEGFTNQDQPPHEKGADSVQNNPADSDIDLSGNLNSSKGMISSGNPDNHQCSDCCGLSSEVDKKRPKELAEIPKQAEKPGHHELVSEDFRHQEQLPIMSQEELEAAIRRISRDSTLDPQKKSFIIQNLLMSRWIITQQKSHSDVFISSNKEVPGQCPSYRDPLKLTFGCKHYKRNCKLVAACCNWLYTCRLCHDDVADHSMDRKATAKMMCMKCLMIQPIGPTCSTVSCNNLSMAKYYCRICKFFDDERDIYHCPYCNLCRVGKGLGIDYFHCMNCNACMSRSLSVHTCREKCLEDNCPICHEYIFTSSAPVKALPCGHLMHSACFQDYTCTHYTCPVCSKSLGDMQVYFAMLDALLAEEKIPDEYSGKTQLILCNDCEKRGTASFHWLYHKCPHCGSYNTRLL